MPFFHTDDLLSTAELKRIIVIFRGLGVVKIRLTGGEPLLRRDVDEILFHIYTLGVADVSMTTNGLLLAERGEALKNAGLRRVNVSLDTFRPDRFQSITGAKALDKVLNGIEWALAAGLSPVKINMVVMRGWNEDEIPEFVRFAEERPVEVRFLELMPTRNTYEGTASVGQEAFVSVEEIRREVERHAVLGDEEPIQGVARSYPIRGGRGKIGFVSPVSNHFCGTCNRVRLTSTGRVKTCLHGESSADLKTALRAGASDGDLAQLVRDALFQKPEEHFIRPTHFVSPHLQMSQVGG